MHCADLHIDSPFKGLSASHPALGEKLRNAAFRAFQNIVQLAIREEVDAVIVAGDVYDSADKSLQAQLKFRRGLEQLNAAGIPVFVAHGNHDPLDGWSASLKFPGNAHIFSGKRVESFPVERDGKTLAHVYGISFPRRDVRENLARLFKRETREGLAVGVLHANVGGKPGHEAYAPCSVEDLEASGMDYWALGHVHAREIVRDDAPAVVYPGNIQARKWTEEGEKGCCLVTLYRDGPPDIRFVPTDVVRYCSDRLDISSCASLDDVMQCVRAKCEETLSRTGGRDAVFRLSLTGRTAINHELQRAGVVEDLMAEVQSSLEGQEPAVWLELLLETRGTYDVDALRQGKDFIADLIAIYDQAARGDCREEIRETLKPLFQDWQGKKYLEPPSDAQLTQILEQARDIALDGLADNARGPLE
ncbi:MAG: DNA repair exonuclease [Nitrospinae bacterium]|nr:DNA repair exonuclease [Nitrospinota bacterium]